MATAPRISLAAASRWITAAALQHPQDLPAHLMQRFGLGRRAAGSLLKKLGVRKIRLTGGEPLLRQRLRDLVVMLSEIPELEDLAMTTNGSLLERNAVALREAGLRRLTVSIDSLDEQIFTAMNDVDFPVAQVLRGIEAARDAGFTPVKINMVVQRGINCDSLLPMAERFRGRDYILRFIEYMDVGTTNGWQLDQVVSGAEIIENLSQRFALNPLEPNYRGEVAKRFRHRDGGGEIGVVTSVTKPFCGDCQRARLSSEGELFTCLFASRGHDLRKVLRDGGTDEDVGEALRSIWGARNDRYSELRSREVGRESRVEMSHIGG